MNGRAPPARSVRCRIGQYRVLIADPVGDIRARRLEVDPLQVELEIAVVSIDEIVGDEDIVRARRILARNRARRPRRPLLDARRGRSVVSAPPRASMATRPCLISAARNQPSVSEDALSENP